MPNSLSPHRVLVVLKHHLACCWKLISVAMRFTIDAVTLNPAAIILITALPAARPPLCPSASNLNLSHTTYNLYSQGAVAYRSRTVYVVVFACRCIPGLRIAFLWSWKPVIVHSIKIFDVDVFNWMQIPLTRLYTIYIHSFSNPRSLTTRILSSI